MGGSRNDVVCFRDMASYIISDKWYNDRKADEAEESHRIILSAAKLIREKIRAMAYSKSEYPSLEDIKNRQKLENIYHPDSACY